MISPPTTKAVATGTGWNRCSLISPPSARPDTTAGTKAISRLRTKRCATAWCVMPATVAPNRTRYSQITANIAPVWIAMSNTFTISPVKLSSDAVRIRCPVLEIGRNSVSPSTMPMIAALTSSRMSKKTSPVRQSDRC